METVIATFANNFDDLKCFIFFIFLHNARGHDCLYFGSGNNNKLVLLADLPGTSCAGRV